MNKILFVIALVICCVSGSPRRAEVYCGGQPCTTTTPCPPKTCPPCVANRCNSPSCWATLLYYPGDCTRYCVCSAGGAIEMPCPPGLHFNEDLGVCDYPYASPCINPDCNGQVTTPCPTTTTCTPTTCTTTTCTPTPTCTTTTCTPTPTCTTTTCTPTPTCTTTTCTPTPTCTTTTCPTTTCTTTTCTPTPTCTTTTCPTTTCTTTTCTPTPTCTTTTCTPTPTCTTTTCTPTPTCTTTTCTPTPTCTTTTCTPKPTCTTTTPCPPPRCPSCVNSLCTPDCYAKGIRYPGDCTRYCVCEVGGAIEMRCPDGLYFDEPKGVCVWPWESCCTNSMSYPSCGIY